MQSEQVIGFIAGIFTSFAMLPQLIKLIQKKEAEEISSFSFIILIVGLGLWIAYGFVKSDYPIIITNMFSFGINLLIFILSIRYSRK